MPGAFLWDERVARAVAFSAVGAQPVASLPLSNLLDPQPRHRTRWLGSAAAILVDFGTDTAIDAVALLSTTLGAADTVRWRLGALEGLVEAAPTFDLRFTSPGTLTYPAGWVFNRTTAGWCFDATGTLAQVAADTPRFDHDPATLACRGLLLEEARTNGIRNPRAEGATPGVIGAGGVLPTNWAVGALGGITVTVVATGTEASIPYCDIRFSGTASGNFGVDCEGWISAAPSDVWTYSAFVRLVAGSLTNVTAVTTRVYYSGGGTNTQGTVTPTNAGLAGQRWASAPATAGTGVGSVKGALRIDVAGAIDLTIRVGAAQLEKGPASSSVILPPAGAPAATTRSADQTRVIGLPIGPATMLIQATHTGSASGFGVTFGGWGPNNDFNNSSYFTLGAGAGTPSFTAISGGVGTNRVLSGSGGYNQPATYVGATGPNAIMFALNSASTASAAAFAQPSTADRAALGGSPWGNPSLIGLASGVGIYQRWALYPTRLADAQVIALASTGSSRVASAVAHDSGTLAAATDAPSQGNVVLLRSPTATGRYLLVDIAAPGATCVDIGRLIAGPLWRISRAVAYGVQEGRETLDRRDRNPLTGAEFPVPALANPRVTRFTLPLLSGAEIRTQHRALLAAQGGAGEALWIPDIGLSQAELNSRSIWGAVAAPGEEALAIRDSPAGTSRSFKIVERV
jgi:hypothetical protein